MPGLVRSLVCWLISAEDLLTVISPGKEAGFNGILDCRLVLDYCAALSCLDIYFAHGQHAVVCVHCLWFCKATCMSFVGSVTMVMKISFGFRFFSFLAVGVHVVFDCIVASIPECNCKQCGFVRRKMNIASTTRSY
jgi:hypothetical protein